MSILYKKLDKESKIEHTWFESSNIFYSKVDLSKQRNTTITEGGVPLKTIVVDVTIVFNRGAQYLYRNVQMHDYLAFREVLNRSDTSSHGKAFNKFIKNYEFDKLSDAKIAELKELKLKFQKEDFKEMPFDFQKDDGMVDCSDKEFCPNKKIDYIQGVHG